MEEVEKSTRKLLESISEGDHHICLIGLNSLQLQQESNLGESV
jgi:hypothetical protein